MATFTNKLLAVGELTNSATDVLAPSGKTLLVHNITIFNKSGGTIIVKISRYNGSTTYQFHEVGISSKKSIDFPYGSEGWVIETGHKLIMESDTATSANYCVDGCEVV
jgi:hypothetical protein